MEREQIQSQLEVVVVLQASFIDRFARQLMHLLLPCIVAVALVFLFGFAALGELSLSLPEYGGCGLVTVNGYVSGGPDSLTWNWGDGSSSESFFPSTHTYKLDGTYVVSVTAHPSGETSTTSVRVLTAEMPFCGCSARLVPAVMALRDGKTSGQLRLEIHDEDGGLLPSGGAHLAWSSSNPRIVDVDASGKVTARGFGFALVTCSVEGYCVASARVHAGSFRVLPPILLLSLEPGRNTGTLAAEILNADGTPVDLSEDALEYQPGNYVASVDARTGHVVALSVPQAFVDTPAIQATLAGMPSDNAAIIRVTTASLGLTPTAHPSGNVDFWFASPVTGHDYARIFTEHDVGRITDIASQLELELMDVLPFNGDTQFLVDDPGYASDGTVPCGLSGNPVRLGTDLDKVNDNSCFIVAFPPDTPQWGVFFHEMGHNYTGASSRFVQFADAGTPNSNFTYGEGLATAVGIYVAHRIEEEASSLRISDGLVKEIQQSVGYFGDLRSLPAYVAAGADYTRIDPNTLDDIVATIAHEFGFATLFRFYSLFVPADQGLPFEVTSDIEQSTVFVAAMSIAAGRDLRSRFGDEWGFPLDDSYYASILPVVRHLVLQRGPGLTTP